MPQTPKPVHIPGTMKGEEVVFHKGREPGRRAERAGAYRSARDSTGINASSRGPIVPGMPDMPPA
jgi:hypothetical protein